MFAWSFLAFCVSAVAFIFHWWKKRKARINAGENYENDADYRKFSGRQFGLGIACVVLFYFSVYALFSDIGDAKRVPAMYGFLTAAGTGVAFIVYWWKKQKARINAGENYADDSEYKKISLHKRIIGLVCLASVVLMVATMPKMTPEEEAEYALRQEMKKKEA